MKIFFKTLAPLATALLVCCNGPLADSCPQEGLVGPGYLQSTIDDYNIYSDRDTIIFERSTGDVLQFVRVQPEIREVIVRSNYRTVACVENEDERISISSELEEISNLFVTGNQDTLQIGLQILNPFLFDPFDFEESDLTKFPVYLKIRIRLNGLNQNYNTTYIAYSDNAEEEVPRDWDQLSSDTLRTASGVLIDPVFFMPSSNQGRIWYSREHGIVGFARITPLAWRVR